MAALGYGAARSALPSALPPDILATKVARPRIPPSYVARAHVRDLMDQGTKRPLTVVSAGPGWGKTLATAAWAGDDSTLRTVAWVSLDPSDNEPRAFWTCFVAAVREAMDVPTDNPLAHLAPGLGSEEAGLQRLMAGIEQLPGPVVVVLDDFHLIDDPSVLEGVATLLRHPMDQLRLVLVTRSDPPLPLHRLRIGDELFEIRSADLAFDDQDAAAMLAADDLDVDPSDVGLLVRRTEGWPAGMRLASLFLGHRDATRTPASFAGDDQVVTDYLVGEVLSSQTPEVQRFLLRTSIVERLSSGLAMALTDQPHGQRHLEELESANAFVVGLGPGREWFRYHALLREVLHHRLTVEDPDALPDLHRRAAEWFVANGFPIEAMRHAAAAEDWPLLGRLFVTRGITLIVSADRSAVERVLAQIPDGRLDDGPYLAVCAAARMFFAGRYRDMEPHLERATHLLHDMSDETARGTSVACRLLTTAVMRSEGDIEGVRRTAAQVLEELSGPGSSVPGSEQYRAIALGNLGTAMLWSGNLEEAGRSLADGLAAARGMRLDVSRINMLAHLALVRVVSGELDAGFELASEAVDLVESRGWAPLSQAAPAYLALSIVRLRRNEIDAAERLLVLGEAAAAREAASRWAMTIAAARLDAAQGYANAAKHRMDSLHEELQGRQLPPFLASWAAVATAELELATGVPDPANSLVERARHGEPMTAEEQVGAARALLSRGEPRGAVDVLAPLRERVADNGVDVDVWLLTAVAADRLREDNRALEALRRATDAAAAQGVRRPFVELHSEHVARLLTLLGRLDQAGGFARGLLEELQPRGADARGAGPTEALTERELVVLRFLPTMMTNAEIAAELFVSVNTVKAHLKRIFRKLDVLSRREAVHRAREIGLLSDTPV